MCIVFSCGGSIGPYTGVANSDGDSVHGPLFFPKETTVEAQHRHWSCYWSAITMSNHVETSNAKRPVGDQFSTVQNRWHTGRDKITFVSPRTQKARLRIESLRKTLVLYPLHRSNSETIT